MWRMDETCAKMDGNALIVLCVDSASDSVSGLEYEMINAFLREVERGSDAGNASTDDNDIVYLLHKIFIRGYYYLIKNNHPCLSRLLLDDFFWSFTFLAQGLLSGQSTESMWTYRDFPFAQLEVAIIGVILLFMGTSKS